MSEPSNEFERRVASGGAWPGPTHWGLPVVALLAVGVGGNAYVAVDRWANGEVFGAVVASVVAFFLASNVLNVCRLRKAADRVARCSEWRLATEPPLAVG